MPDEPQPQPVSITEFLGRTVLDLPTTDDFHAFASEIRSIGDAMNSLSTNLKDAIESQQKLAEIYERGFSKQASTASPPEGKSAPPTGASDNASTATTAEVPGTGQAAATPAAEEANRQALAGGDDGTYSWYEKKLLRAAAIAPGRPKGDPPTTPEEQLNASRPKDWRQLHYGEWKTQDFLEGGANVAGMLAGHQQRKYQGQIDQTKQGLMDQGATEEEALQQAQGQVGDAPKAAMLAANTLSTGAQYMPLADMGHVLAGKLGYNISLRALSQQGEEAGQPSGQGAVDVGPLRIPAGTGLAGLRQNWDQLKDAALTPGYNKREADTVYNELQSLGFRGQSGFPGQRFRDMRSAGKQIMQYSKEVGNNEGTYELMDKATRWGTEGLKDFVGSMKQVPDAATKAGVTVSQLISDMNQAGEMNQSLGGTHAQGQEFAKDIAKQGLPPGPFTQATTNPLVQGKLFQQTGLLPWQQGLTSTSQRMGALMDSVNQTYAAIGKYPDRAQSLPGLAGRLGARTTITGQDQAIAQLHQLHPELSPEILKHLVNPKEREALQAGFSARDATRSWGKGVAVNLPDYKYGRPFQTPAGPFEGITGTIKDPKKLEGLENSFDPRVSDGKSTAFTWGDEIKTLDQAKTLDPNTDKLKPLMNKSDWRSVALAGLPKDQRSQWQKADLSKAKWETLAKEGGPDVKKMEKGGISREERLQLKHAGHDRQKAIEKILDDKNKTDTGGPKVTVELGPAAKKVLHIQTSRQEAAKAARQGGAAAVVNMGQPSQGFSPFSTGDPSGLPVSPGGDPSGGAAGAGGGAGAAGGP